jgi:hypothetical protein
MVCTGTSLFLGRVIITSVPGFCHNGDTICTLLGYYAASCGITGVLGQLWVPSSRVKEFQAGKKGTNCNPDSRRVGAQGRYSVSVIASRDTLFHVFFFHPSFTPVKPYWLSPYSLSTTPVYLPFKNPRNSCRLSFWAGLLILEDGTNTLS